MKKRLLSEAVFLMAFKWCIISLIPLLYFNIMLWLGFGVNIINVLILFVIINLNNMVLFPKHLGIRQRIISLVLTSFVILSYALLFTPLMYEFIIESFILLIFFLILNMMYEGYITIQALRYFW